MLDIAGSLQLLHAPEASWLGVFGMDFSWVMPKEKSFHAASAAVFDGDWHLFGNVLTPLWFKYVKILRFTT